MVQPCVTELLICSRNWNTNQGQEALSPIILSANSTKTYHPSSSLTSLIPDSFSEPGISVECGEDHMQISLERRHFVHFQLSMFHLRYRSCRATGLNDSHISFYTLLNDCGTSHNESGDELAYWNEVQVDRVVNGGVVSRMYDVSIPFYCAYSKKKLVTGGSYKPRRVVFAPEGKMLSNTFPAIVLCS